MSPEQIDQIYQIDPNDILADDNARYALKPARIDRLAQEIEEHGGVHTPVEVEVLDKPVDGKEYRLTVGHYRHAAVSKLNAESNAGLMLPAIARNPANATARLRRQLSENIERENLSPMDQAVAIGKLIAAGVSKLEIRTIFSRANGKQVVPASNAWVNITARLLDLPKSIQSKIHSGEVGFAAAYELGKVSPDKREAVLTRAIKDRQAEIDEEVKDEQKYLTGEKQAQTWAAEAEASTKAAEAARVEAELAEARANKAATEVKSIKVNKKQPAAAQKLTLAKLNKAKAALKEAESAMTAQEKAVAKHELLAKSLAARAEAKLKALEEGKAAVKKLKAAKPVTDREVKKAAKAETGAAVVTLKAAEMRAAVTELLLPAYPTVSKIGQMLLDCFDSKLTPSQMLRAMAELVQEPNLPKVKTAAKNRAAA